MAQVTLPTLDLCRLRHLAIVLALRQTKGDVTQAARLLGVSRGTVYRHLAQHPQARRESALDPAWCERLREERPKGV